LTKDDVEGQLELYLSFHNTAPALQEYGPDGFGLISLTYAFELPEAEQLSAVPLPAGFPLLFVGIGVLACVRRR
jgi:hypothetical protein